MNLAASFSPELMDLCIYVIDVAAGDRIPRKGNERPWCFTNLHTGEGVEDFLLHQLPLRCPSLAAEGSPQEWGRFKWPSCEKQDSATLHHRKPCQSTNMGYLQCYYLGLM